MAVGSNAQDRMLRDLPAYLDQAIIDKYQDSLQKIGITRFITFLTTKNGLNVTYFIWPYENRLKVLEITDSSISKTKTIRSDILNNIQIEKLAIRESERKVKMIPPVIDPTGSDLAFIVINKKKFLVESGRNTYYTLTVSRKKEREKFILDLHKQVNLFNDKWELDKKYNRF